MRIPHTIEALDFTIADINEAIRANPENPKLYLYLEEREDCYIKRREILEKRGYRKDLKVFTGDPLTVFPAIKVRRKWSNVDYLNSHYARDRFKMACYLLGWQKLFERRKRK